MIHLIKSDKVKRFVMMQPIDNDCEPKSLVDSVHNSQYHGYACTRIYHVVKYSRLYMLVVSASCNKYIDKNDAYFRQQLSRLAGVPADSMLINDYGEV